MRGWEKVRKLRMDFSELSAVERTKISALNEITELAMRADKYVFVSPMWNWGIPPRLKGVHRRVRHRRKDVPLHGARASRPAARQKSAAHPIVRRDLFLGGDGRHGSQPSLSAEVLGIVGIRDVQALYVEGHDFQPARAKEIIRAAMEQAAKLAAAW